MNISVECNQNGRQHIISNLFQLFIRHKWTLKGLEDTAKLMNSMPGALMNIPSSKYLLIKELLDVSEILVFYHFCCMSCEKYTRSNFNSRQKTSKCVSCGGTLSKSDFFVSFDIKQQIASVINANFDDIKQFCDSKKKNASISDVYDGNHIKNIQKRNENILSVTLNTDGVSIIDSNSSSLWPVLLSCNFLPPKIRFKNTNIIVAALHFGKKKPNMYELLRPLAEEFKILSKGIFVREKFFNIFVTIAALDLPAKSDVSKFVQHNSKHACNFCLQRGESTSKGIRYAYESQQSESRTHESIIKDMVQVKSKPNTIINGVKAVSPMIAFQHFDLSKGFCIDYMHAVLLGVTKKIIGFWTLPAHHKKSFYMNKKRREILDKRLSKIQTPSYISRRPRSINSLKQFKASELRSLLIYYLPVIVDGLLPRQYIEHLMLLSSSIYVLLQPSISDNELNECERKIKKFVYQYEKYYGKTNMTMNVHCLLHLVQCVRDFGPLWTFSMFSFESYNGLLKSFVVAPTDVLHQLVTRYVCYKTFGEEKVDMAGTNIHQSEVECKLENAHIKAIEESGLVCLETDGLKVYSRFQKNGITFTSRLYSKAKKAIDFHVETITGELGAVEFYFLCNGEYYAIFERLNEVERVNQFRKVNFSNQYTVIQANDIVDRFVRMEIRKENFLVKRPNVYERN